MSTPATAIINEPVKTFTARDGTVYKSCPCEDWLCTRLHEVLRTGPAFACFHPVEARS